MTLPELRPRTLTSADAGIAADFLEPLLFEVPLFSWLAGEDADDELRRWVVDLQLAEPLAGGHVHVVESDGELLGLAVWTPPGWESAGITPEFRDRSVAVLSARLDAAARLARLAEIAGEHQPDPADVCVHLAVLSPGHRGVGVLEALVDPAFDAAYAKGAGLVTLTSVSALTGHLVARFGMGEVDDYELDGVPVWVYRCSADHIRDRN